ncbi:hypothetical protein P4N68_12430 [Corynebacterium felinum]|uniref:Secreted protein n=1 Tax=Corynebacterium felinum TaxID=131318 RepID=A0ABU2B9L2_9CORY|nr:hypothetical protein [Corynebacterium felinum]MDF5821874.1 hypothetical protein [Corynebacterium felinum]MDR7355314.1 hypothetical protein [Corynebacterium felinum]WJY94667.1 hypothetical protein CFELI_05195 [Corynebacterium felinum]
MKKTATGIVIGVLLIVAVVIVGISWVMVGRSPVEKHLAGKVEHTQITLGQIFPEADSFTLWCPNSREELGDENRSILAVNAHGDTKEYTLKHSVINLCAEIEESGSSQGSPPALGAQGSVTIAPDEILYLQQDSATHAWVRVSS